MPPQSIGSADLQSAAAARATNLSAKHQRSGHIPALDGIRGLAVLMVLVFHFIGTVPPANGFERLIIGVANYGSYGVELFFILSGFLITGILYDSRHTPNYFRNFYMRRVLRIFPLYYGVLILVFLIAPLIPLFQGPTLDYLRDRQLWAWLYAINFHIGLSGAWSFSYLNHFWSLAVEEHFYLVWPFVVFLLVDRPRVLIATCLAVVIACVLARFTGLLVGLNWWTTYVLTPFRLDGLALGGLFAVVWRQPGGKERLTAAIPVIVTVACGLFIATFVWTKLISSSGTEFIMLGRALVIQFAFAALLLTALTASGNSIVGRFACSRWLMWMGTYSYGLYVYHHFISYAFETRHTDVVLAQMLGSHALAVVLQATLGAAASVAIAYLSYEYFEKRFLALKPRFEAAKP